MDKSNNIQSKQSKEQKREFIRELFYQISTEPDFELTSSSYPQLNFHGAVKTKKRHNGRKENDVVILSIDFDSHIDPSQFATL